MPWNFQQTVRGMNLNLNKDILPAKFYIARISIRIIWTNKNTISTNVEIFAQDDYEAKLNGTNIRKIY